MLGYLILDDFKLLFFSICLRQIDEREREKFNYIEFSNQNTYSNRIISAFSVVILRICITFFFHLICIICNEIKCDQV